MKPGQGALIALVVAGQLFFPADALAGQPGQDETGYRSLFDAPPATNDAAQNSPIRAPFAIGGHDPQEHVDWRGNWRDAHDLAGVHAAGLRQLQLGRRAKPCSTARCTAGSSAPPSAPTSSAGHFRTTARSSSRRSHRA